MKIMRVVACSIVLLPLAIGRLAPPAALAPANAAQRVAAASGEGTPPSAGARNDASPAQPQSAAPLEVPGRTRCMLSRRGIIAAAVLRPVVEVLVQPGDRVKKGQALIKLFDLEPQAKVRAREQDLKSIQAKAQYSRRNLELADNSRGTGAIPQRSLNDLRAQAMSNDALVLAAEAELAHAQGELKLYTVSASIDGEFAWLDVSPGTVSWPGAMMWGEIIDLRELDVRCDLAPVLADQVAVGQTAEISLEGKVETVGTGKVVFVGKAADRNTGLVPVVIRMPNPHEQVRAEVAVKVRVQTEKGK